MSRVFVQAVLPATVEARCVTWLPYHPVRSSLTARRTLREKGRREVDSRVISLDGLNSEG
jgi:hypothetical protein